MSVDVGTRTQTVADPNGTKSTTTTFDDQGDPISVAVFDGTHTLTTTSSFDAAGRRTDVTDPAGHHQHWAYDESTTPANGNLSSYTDAAGRTWTLTGYNSFGQAGQIVDPTGSVYVTNTYQPGTPLLASQQVAGQGASSYSYYPNGLMHVASDPGGRSVSYGYNSSGYKISQADSAGATATYTPDGAGRDLKIVDAAGRTVGYGYNGTGDITTVTDPGTGDTWAYHYNTRDQLDVATDPTGAHTSYAFNDAGLVTSRTDRNGAVTGYGYDADGNVTSETRPGGDVTSYTYTPLEQLAETDNASGEDTFSYDAAGNAASQTSCAPQPGHGPCAAASSGSSEPTVTLGYTWNPDGQAATLTGPAGQTRYNYDPLGRLGQVTDPSNQTFGVGYDPGGRLGTLTRPNGVNDTFSYTPSGDLTSIVSALGGTQVASTGYGIDPVTGRATTRTDQTGTTSYGYEPDGVLASVTPPAGSTQPAEAYTSDNFANRLTGPSAADVSHYTAGSRLASDGINTFTYDGEGDLKTQTVIATGKVTGFDWNADHQLTAVHLPNGEAATYEYDPLGHRISAAGPSGTTRYVWDHWNVIATYNATNDLASTNVTMPTTSAGITSGQPANIIEEIHGTTHTYPIHDPLGSVTALTNQAGTVTDQISYSAYGVPTGTSANTDISTYTSYQHDPDTGLYYANHRYYNPRTGRFLSQDPVAAVNPYMYTHGDPVNFTDPSGQFELLGESLLESTALGAVAGFGSGVVLCGGESGVPPMYQTSEQWKDYAECVGTSTAVGAAGGAFGYGVNATGFGPAGPGIGSYFEHVNKLVPIFGCIALGIWDTFTDSTLGATMGKDPDRPESAASFVAGCATGALKAGR